MQKFKIFYPGSLLVCFASFNRSYSQEEFWSIDYPTTSNEPVLTLLDDQRFALTGQWFKLPEGWNTFTDFYTIDGRLIHKLLWRSSRFD